MHPFPFHRVVSWQVVTSPFSRAKETAEAIQDCLDCELREERYGDRIVLHNLLHAAEKWAGDDKRRATQGFALLWLFDICRQRCVR